MIKTRIKYVFVGVTVIMGVVCCLCIFYYTRWSPQWKCSDSFPSYEVAHHNDDTLRIGFIGDSWVGLRTRTMDSLLAVRLSQQIGKPVKVMSKGKGGAKSRGIYELMFEEKGDGTKPLIAAGLDYCIISAGINDAAANLGTKQYEHHLRLIINFLLNNGIRPVMLDAPDVNIWNIYGDKPLKDLMTDFIKSRMTRSGMYHYAEYRETMRRLLDEVRTFSQGVILLPMEKWNGKDKYLNAHLFQSDSIHLNNRGYEVMDSCLARTIASHLK